VITRSRVHENTLGADLRCVYGKHKFTSPTECSISLTVGLPWRKPTVYITWAWCNEP